MDEGRTYEEVKNRSLEWMIRCILRVCKGRIGRDEIVGALERAYEMESDNPDAPSFQCWDFDTFVDEILRPETLYTSLIDHADRWWTTAEARAVRESTSAVSNVE